MGNAPASKRSAPHAPTGWRGLRIAALACLTALLLPAADRVTPDVESQVKAAFVPKLAGFVEWPATAFETTNSPLCLVLLGDDALDAAFDAEVVKLRIHSRPVTVTRVKSTEALDPAVRCHILIVGRAETPRWSEIFAAYGTRPVLTLGDAEGFTEAGGVLNFAKVEGKVRFEVNPEAAEKAGLKISSRLLQVSKVIPAGKHSRPQ